MPADAVVPEIPRTLKVGVVVHCPSPHQKVWLDEVLSVAGADVVVVYAFADDRRRDWGLHRASGRTVVLPTFRGLSGGHRLRTWVEALDRDVWVLGSAFTYARTQAMATVFTALGIPWAFLGEPPRPRSGPMAFVRDWMLHRILRHCHGVIATGVEPGRRYRTLLGDDRPVTSVPYYIPLEDWLALPGATPPAEGEPLRFISLAQLIHRKGLDLLVEACGLLPRDGWRLDIYGDGPERNRLERAIAARSLPISVHCSVPFDRRSEAFRGAHCFVFPSRWDGWGMAPVEALAAGLPVIASDQTMSAYDFIENNINGWIVPCDPGTIATAMQAVLARPERLPELARAARASVAMYEPRTGAFEFVDFCRHLVASHEHLASAT